MKRTCRCLNCITPPHILIKLLESNEEEIRRAAMNTLMMTARLRGERSVRAVAGFLVAPSNGRRTIYDCRTDTRLSSATVARTEDGDASKDKSVNRAFDGFGTTRDFYMKVFDRDSIDAHGMRLDGYVHRGIHYNNAFWDGQEMVFGDGDGRVFSDFTGSLDVIAHELTHGVTEFTANLEYHKQSGALNESISDVFGSLVKQWSLHQKVDEADWLIGAEVFTPQIKADALRSMKSPGKAYNNNLLGKDPQPDHMDKFMKLPDTEEGDWGGVHINSGIPNKAFYLTATNIGGFAWEAPGHIWYASLLASNEATDFKSFADTTCAQAGQIYGAGSKEQKGVVAAWEEVGIRIAVSGGVGLRQKPTGMKDEDVYDSLVNQIQTLTTEVKALTKEIKALKKK
jgi:Zn-dependent metalloprotease